MARCAKCDAELLPEWKFCILCGTPVDPAREPRSPVPAAIRPEVEPEAAERRRIDIPLILGVALGIGGLALIVYLVVVIGGTS